MSDSGSGNNKFAKPSWIGEEALTSDNQSSESESDEHRKQRKRKKGQRTKNINRIQNDRKIASLSVIKLGENANFKRSIEIRNGIAIRSTNNVHRMTNSITLHCYVVSECLR